MRTAGFASFYREHLEQSIMPFWLERASDREQGGVNTCYSNDGSARFSQDKYIWSQGRYLWLLARTADLAEQGKVSANLAQLHMLAKGTLKLLKRARLPHGRYAFLLDSEGRLKESLAGEGHAISVFVDCFVALGFADYARVTKDEVLLLEALELYGLITSTMAQPTVPSEPYPVPPGCRAHAFDMLLLHLASTLGEAAETLGHPETSALFSNAQRSSNTIFERFTDDSGLLVEVIGNCDAPILKRHLNPGHALESMWFVLHEARRRDDTVRIDQAAKIIKTMFARGWDEVHGGLFRFCKVDDSWPTVRSNDPYETLIVETWDTKLWWPHSEALYSTLLAAILTNDAEMHELHERVNDYTFKTFPNPDTSIGEWIQIRDRQGQPLERVVALPVKDPYHIYRTLLLLVELLS